MVLLPSVIAIPPSSAMPVPYVRFAVTIGVLPYPVFVIR
jgi:hypothetical protein